MVAQSLWLPINTETMGLFGRAGVLREMRSCSGCLDSDIIVGTLILVEDFTKMYLPCPSSLREEARRRDSPALTGHSESLTPTLSLRERG
jgi:hypothetical protein